MTPDLVSASTVLGVSIATTATGAAQWSFSQAVPGFVLGNTYNVLLNGNPGVVTAIIGGGPPFFYNFLHGGPTPPGTPWSVPLPVPGALNIVTPAAGLST